VRWTNWSVYRGSAEEKTCRLLSTSIWGEGDNFLPNKAKKPLVSISPWLELEKQSQMIWRISNLEMFPFAQRFETWGAESRSDEPDEATRSVPARKGKTSAWKQARLQHRLGHRRLAGRTIVGWVGGEGEMRQN
jgi:hypothetical protein